MEDLEMIDSGSTSEEPVADPVADPVVETPVEEPSVEDPPVQTPEPEIPAEDPLPEIPAEEPVEGETPAEEPEVTENEQSTESQEDPEEAFPEDEEFFTELIPEPSTFTVTSPVVLAVAESGDGNTVMVDVISSVLGDYQRLTYTTEEYDSSGNLISVSTEYVPGLAGLDYNWITGAILFGLLVGGLLKLLGGLIRS